MRPFVRSAALAFVILTAPVAATMAAPASQPAATEQAQPEFATPQEAAEAFLRHLRKGDFAKAYAMAAPELEAKVSAADFGKHVAPFQQAGIQSVRWQNAKSDYKLLSFDPVKGWRWNVVQTQFQGLLTSARAGQSTLHFNWINEDGTWRMLAFRWDEAPRTSQAR